jgi:hypothetical protein
MATIAQSLHKKIDLFALSAGQWRFVIEEEWVMSSVTSGSPNDGAFSFETSEGDDDEGLPEPESDPQETSPPLSSEVTAHAAATGSGPSVKKGAKVKIRLTRKQRQPGLHLRTRLRNHHLRSKPPPCQVNRWIMTI